MSIFIYRTPERPYAEYRRGDVEDIGGSEMVGLILKGVWLDPEMHSRHRRYGISKLFFTSPGPTELIDVETISVDATTPYTVALGEMTRDKNNGQLPADEYADALQHLVELSFDGTELASRYLRPAGD